MADSRRKGSSRPRPLYENQRCGTCKKLKSHSEFTKDRSRSQGISWECKLCKRERDKARRATLEPGWHRDFALRKYGITQKDYARLLAEQGGGCAICGATDAGMHNWGKKGIKSSLHVDHDHESGKVRGILCGPCNHGIGQLKDDPARLRRAAAYLDGRLM